MKIGDLVRLLGYDTSRDYVGIIIEMESHPFGGSHAIRVHWHVGKRVTNWVQPYALEVIGESR